MDATAPLDAVLLETRLVLPAPAGGGADPARLDPPVAPVTAAGADETAFVRATGTHPTLVHHRHH